MDRVSRGFPLLSFLRRDDPLLDSCTEDGCPDHLLDGSLLLIVKYMSKKGKQRELGSSPNEQMSMLPLWEKAHE